MTTRLGDVIAFLDSVLEIRRLLDRESNGLQVEGGATVNRVVTGVSANAALIERAVELDADLIVVHYGLSWSRGPCKIAGVLAQRLKRLLANDVSLAAYDVPLTQHPVFGDNPGLADAVGLTGEREVFGDRNRHALGLAAAFDPPLTRAEAVSRIAAGVLGGATLPFVFPHGPEVVRRVGLCAGASSELLEDAARAGCDLFLTGELSERSGELARELGISLVAAGHHATGVFGPQRLGDELRRRFPDLEVQFVDIPSPL